MKQEQKSKKESRNSRGNKCGAIDTKVKWAKDSVLYNPDTDQINLVIGVYKYKYRTVALVQQGPKGLDLSFTEVVPTNTPDVVVWTYLGKV